MKITYFFLSLCLIGLSTNMGITQDTLATDWTLIESSPLANGNAEAWAIGADQDGNLFWGVNKDMPGFLEFMDALVYKLDEESNLIWIDTAVSGAFAQQSYNLKVTDSLIYLGGRSCRALGIDSCDVLFFATDGSSGTTAWDFVWDGGYGYEEIDGISIESDGIIITGWTAGSGTNVDVLLMKIDFEGNIIWQTSWGGLTPNDDHQDGHIVVDDTMIYISGLYEGSPLLGWDGSALLAKFDKTNGAFVDSLTYGRDDQWVNAENALGMTTDGTYLYTTGYTTTSLNNWDIFVAKFDKDLNQIWYTSWGGEEQAESARAITVDSDGSIYIGGTTESFGNGEMDAVLLKLKANGDLEWYKTWGSTQDDQILDIYLDGDKLYLTGKTNSFHPTQKWEALLLKVSLDVINSDRERIADQLSELYFYPNPMTETTLLKWSDLSVEPDKLVVYNAMGQRIMTMDNIENGEIRIERKDLESGVFFFQLWNQNQAIAIGKLVVN